MTGARAGARVGIIGAGGLGTPVAFALARAGVGTLVLVDDDFVDRSNLHRQILFRDADVGRHKLEAARDALRRLSPRTVVEVQRERLHPGNVGLLSAIDVLVECSDRYAVKFLAADAAQLLRKPLVVGAAIRWIGTALCTSPEGRPCYRCLFEDLPEGAQQSCDVAGVVGPVCGVVGALQASFVLGILDGRPRFGTLASFDGRAGTLRRRAIAPRPGCPLCGTHATIDRIEPTRYVSDPCPQ